MWYQASMSDMKTVRKHPPLTDAERHKRFIDTAREVGADESHDAFDRAFGKVVTAKPKA
jgi:hypothetical protein